VGLKKIGNKTLSKANDVTVGTAARQGAIGGAEYQLKNKYIYQPGFEAVDNLLGRKTSGLSDDVVDQLDAALG
jgi:hypothetical protein